MQGQRVQGPPHHGRVVSVCVCVCVCVCVIGVQLDSVPDSVKFL